jgi:23S rRNA (pseudouridine1915-N3)-methyltransferase
LLVRLRLVCVDKVRERYVADAVDDFVQRLRRYDSVDVVEVPATRGTDAQRAVRAENEALLHRIARGEHVWLLERTGTSLSSVELAERLSGLATQGISRLTLVVAGAYGASEALVERADFQWSLSRLTLLHEWARALAVEQLYRATKIARNEPYHH